LLWAGQSVSNPRGAGVRFSDPIQTSLETHPASYAMGTGSLSWGVKQPGHGTDHPPLLAVGSNMGRAVSPPPL